MATSEKVSNAQFPINRSCGHCRGTGLFTVEDNLTMVCPDCLDVFLGRAENLCRRILNDEPGYSEDWAQHLQLIIHHLHNLVWDARTLMEYLRCLPVAPDEDLDLPF